MEGLRVARLGKHHGIKKANSYLPIGIAAHPTTHPSCQMENINASINLSPLLLID
jgi:hypothetical protein